MSCRGFSLEILGTDRQFIHAQIEENDGRKLILSFAYVRPYSEEKAVFWGAMDAFSNLNQLPWVLIGDFNDYASQDEKVGGCVL